MHVYVCMHVHMHIHAWHATYMDTNMLYALHAVITDDLHIPNNITALWGSVKYVT